MRDVLLKYFERGSAVEADARFSSLGFPLWVI